MKRLAIAAGPFLANISCDVALGESSLDDSARCLHSQPAHEGEETT